MDQSHCVMYASAHGETKLNQDITDRDIKPQELHVDITDRDIKPQELHVNITDRHKQPHQLQECRHHRQRHTQPPQLPGVPVAPHYSTRHCKIENNPPLSFTKTMLMEVEACNHNA